MDTMRGDRDKLYAALNYLWQINPGDTLFRLYVILYVADKMHLQNYGRWIWGNYVVGKTRIALGFITPKAAIDNADQDCLSESDRQCLCGISIVLARVKTVDMAQYMQDDVWQLASVKYGWQDPIPDDLFVDLAPSSDELRDYLLHQHD